MSKRKSVSTLFAAAALAFLLPFGTVSCDAERVSVTGIELATFTVDGAGEPDSLAAEVEAHGLWALIALVLALIGASVASLRDRGGGYAAAGLCALFVLGFNADAILGPEIDYEIGYLLSLTAFAAAGLTRFFVRVKARSRDGESVWPWVLGLVLGTPVTATVLLWVGVGAV